MVSSYFCFLEFIVNFILLDAELCYVFWNMVAHCSSSYPAEQDAAWYYANQLGNIEAYVWAFLQV